MPMTLLVIADPAAAHLSVLQRLPADMSVFVSNEPAALREHAPEADVILNTPFRGDLLAGLLPHATRAQWIHSLFTGVEGILTPEVVASRLPLTNGRGVFRVPLAEWTIGAMIHFSYQHRRLIAQQAAEIWKQFPVETLQGTTLGIVGYGGIGSETAARAKGFGMRVVALRRRTAGANDDPRVDRFYSPGDLHDLVAESDHVLLSTPLTRETRGMFGAAEIDAMKPSAVLINVGRGAVVDEGALVRALEAKSIRGAALDVFDVEPLPAGHPLYKLENVLLSPHCADQTRDFLNLGYEAFFENLQRFRNGEPLEHVVDKQAGY
jgi:phosphoglycerate dehydrogenase-like enzyme